MEKISPLIWKWPKSIKKQNKNQPNKRKKRFLKDKNIKVIRGESQNVLENDSPGISSNGEKPYGCTFIFEKSRTV